MTLNEEIENVRDYCYLLKARYGDWITVIFDIQHGIEYIAMPALIFQPLVENAFIHGLGDSEDGGEIKITIADGR